MIRLATIKDASRIAEINVSGWRFAYKDIVSEEILYRETLVENRIQDVKNWILNNDYMIYVYQDGRNKIIKGMMGFNKCKDTDKVNCFELYFLYVEPYYSKNGIGSKMIQFFEKEGIKLGYNEFIIWVLKENEIGINCYKKNNYHRDGTEKIYKRFNKIEVRYKKLP